MSRSYALSPSRALLTALLVLSLLLAMFAAMAVRSDTASARAQKVSLCHATGSRTNPFVLIRVSPQGAANHLRQHEDDRLATPAEQKAGDCPVKGEDDGGDTGQTGQN